MSLEESELHYRSGSMRCFLKTPRAQGCQMALREKRQMRVEKSQKNAKKGKIVKKKPTFVKKWKMKLKYDFIE